MFRKRKTIIDTLLAGAFIFFLLCFLLRIKGAYTTVVYHPSDVKAYYKDEEFDPSYFRLNTMDKLVAYSDSLCKAGYLNGNYPDIVSEVIRKKFFHGYSSYTINTNPVGSFIAALTEPGIAAIVLPEDIVKYPNAACSQQSIVGMELFRRKGYQVRKVVMFDQQDQAGHFAYEAYYDGGWHFFDTNQEPDTEVLKKYKRPSAAFLAHHLDIVAIAYRKRGSAFFQRLMQSYKVGPINKFPAPYAYYFQKATLLLTNFGWAFFLTIIIIRKWVFRRKFVLGSANSYKQKTNPQPQGQLVITRA